MVERKRKTGRPVSGAGFWWRLERAASKAAAGLRRSSFFNLILFYFIDVDHFFKAFIEFVTMMHLFYALFFWPWVIQDLRFPTRDRTCNSSIGRGRINPQTTRAALRSSCFTETSSQWRQAWARKKRNCRVEKKKRTGCWVPFQNNRQNIYDSSSYIKKMLSLPG